MEKIEWSAPEYEEKERGSDWFWALGVIVIAGSIASIIYANYFFAILLILGGIMLRFYAKRKPDMIYYELGDKGFRIQNELFPYVTIKSFYVRTEIQPAFFIHSSRFFLPVIHAPIHAESGERIRTMMLEKNIPEEEMAEHAAEKIMEHLGL